MENFYYIHQGKILWYEENLLDKVELSNDYDQQQTLHVPLSEQQVAFHLANPTASVSEVWNMALTIAPQPTNADVEVMRQQAYLNESNPIMFASRQYFELGEMEKYEAKHTEWVAKVQEIRDRYPYIIQ